MNVNGSRRIAASRARVWQALRDPVMVGACLPGCQALEQLSPGEYQGRVAGQVGTVASVFDCRATVSEEDVPQGWTVAAHAHSGTAGWLDGIAVVSLSEEAGATVLGYRARVEAGGRLSTLGERLLHGAAVRLAETFLTNLAERLGAERRMGPARGRPGPAPGGTAARAAPSLSVPPEETATLPSAEPPTVPPPSSDPRHTTVVLLVGLVLWAMVLLLVFAPGH